MPLDPIYDEIGRKVRDARLRVGKTQQAVADHLGKRRSTVTNIEHGRQRLPLDMLLDIAQFLGVEPLTLLPDAVAGADPDGLAATVQVLRDKLDRISAIVRQGEQDGEKDHTSGPSHPRADRPR